MNDIVIEELLVKKLKNKNLTISTAESCTGGLVAATIVNVSGASDVFNEGYVTYANEAKNRILGVDNEVLNTVGAVSAKTAKMMAKGCARNAHADIGISTTGIAGPGGGTKEKPVGLVYIGCYYKGKEIAVKNIFEGDRTTVRNSAVKAAIKLAIDIIDKDINSYDSYL
ncbi:MAG: CinA family protein [Lachnospiraceae bacterium]|nr:CinA family protein [Lachnospiraceae bacterium]